MNIGSVSRMRLGLAVALLLALPRAVSAVTCPNGGAVLNVVVHNPTGNPVPTGVTISGLTNYGNGITCTSASSTYSRSIELTADETNVFQFTGLNTGVWTHRITVSVGSNQYSQYEKTTVLEATGSGGSPYSTAEWTYFPQSVTVTTGATVNASADGVYGDGGSSNIQTDRNVVRNNTGYGMDVTALPNLSPALSLSNDYVCGNGSDGIYLYGPLAGVAAGTGLGVAYNDGGGVVIDYFDYAPTLTFDNNSAFTANAGTGFVNGTGFTVSAVNNQWRGVTNGCASSPDVYGLVDCDPVQDPLAVNVAITGTNPVVPSNVITAAQTIQVQGTGFNAIDGNPLAGETCSTGYGTGSGNCCRNTSKANACDGSTPPKAIDHSNCVALLDRAASWQRLNVASVTPTTITTQIPTNFACIGNDGELVRVSKLDSNNREIYGVATYCTNVDPK